MILQPAGLLRTLEQILRDCRREARVASAAKKRSKNISCDAGTLLAQELLPAVSTDINEVGERGENTTGRVGIHLTCHVLNIGFRELLHD